MSAKIHILIAFVVGVAVGIIIGVVIVKPDSQPSDGLRAAFNEEFVTRSDGYRGLSVHYGFRFQSEPLPILMKDLDSKYQKLITGEVDVIESFATDASIRKYDMAVLEDDKRFFPPYEAAPLVRAETLTKHPKIEGILNELTGKIPNETMQRLNYEVDIEGHNVHDVAREFLESKGLIPPDAKPGDGSAGSITIGSKNFTESKILSEIMATLIEYSSDIKVFRKLSFGGTLMCFYALRVGELDLYPEYTGTGLVHILRQEIIHDPDQTYETVQEEFKSAYGLVWLQRCGLNNTYTLHMRSERAKELGIETISNLATYVNRQQR